MKEQALRPHRAPVASGVPQQTCPIIRKGLISPYLTFGHGQGAKRRAVTHGGHAGNRSGHFTSILELLLLNQAEVVRGAAGSSHEWKSR